MAAKGDRERYPRRGFGIVFESQWGFAVDTFAGRVTKDLVSIPDTTIDLRLSDAQLDTLYDAVLRMRLFDYPEPHPITGPVSVFPNAYGAPRNPSTTRTNFSGSSK